MASPWLIDYADATRGTNVLPSADQAKLLVAGLVGEVGGILAELKKAVREGPAYPRIRRRLAEEIGDFLWYFVRLCEVAGLDVSSLGDATDIADATDLETALQLAAYVGSLAQLHARPAIHGAEPKRLLIEIWPLLERIAGIARISLSEAADQNRHKTRSRWPSDRVHHALFDEDAPSECRLPRLLTMEFHEVEHHGRPQVLLRCHELNIGDRVTDNAHGDDGYRFHDVFHLAHAVHLGWSPVLRALLRCKRKYDSRLDEVEDGARAIALEEAISALVYRRAQSLEFFKHQSQLDFDLLKSIADLVVGLEVETMPYWQWEAAILDGYRVFAELRANRGGRVTVDLHARGLTYDGACTPLHPQLHLPGIATNLPLALETT